MEEKIAVIGLLIATILWAISGVTFDFLMDNGIGFVLILFVIILVRFFTVTGIAYWKGLRGFPEFDRRELKFSLLNGFFALMTPAFLLLALQYTKLSNVYFLAYTAPAWVLVGSVFILGEKINLKKFLGLLLTISGVYLIANPADLSNVDFGVLLGLLAGVSFAADIITGRELKDYSYHAISIFANGFQSIVLLIVVLFFTGIPKFDHHGFFLLILVLIGILRGIASDLYYYAMEKLEAQTASILSLGELIFASILAFIFLNQIPLEIELVGYSLVLFSTVIIILRKADIEHFEYLLHLRRKH